MEKVPVIFHNAKFDLAILIHTGIITSAENFKELNDTMLMSFLQDEERQRHGLKFLAKEVLKIDEADIVKFKDVTKKPELKGKGTLFE